MVDILPWSDGRRGNDFEGTLIAIEGIDGAGKSAVAGSIASWADDEGEDVVVSAEPTDMWTGEQVYRALGDEETPALADFFLFVADRAKHVEERIKPALERGAIVVTDRYADSTRAYQTHRIADEMDAPYEAARAWMEGVFDPWNIEPDLTIYIDIPVDVALERAGGSDKYEKRDNLERVKDAYDDLYGLCDADVRIIDGTRSLSAVQHKAVNVVKTQLVLDEEDSERGKWYADAIDDQ